MLRRLSARTKQLAASPLAGAKSMVSSKSEPSRPRVSTAVELRLRAAHSSSKSMVVAPPSGASRMA